MTEEDVREYLDTAIRYWRKVKVTTDNEEVEIIAGYYIDAYQSVRVSLLGKPLGVCSTIGSAAGF